MPTPPTPCPHSSVYWYPATNEDGWKCIDCGVKPGEPPGFDPKRDRDDIWSKVWAILHDLCDANIVYVSNGSGVDALTSVVAAKCKRRKRFDQYSIALYILQEMTPRHAEYWRKVSEGVLSGKDPRDRCACGALSNTSCGDKRWCSDCYRKEAPW